MEEVGKQQGDLQPFEQFTMYYSQLSFLAGSVGYKRDISPATESSEYSGERDSLCHPAVRSSDTYSFSSLRMLTEKEPGIQ